MRREFVLVLLIACGADSRTVQEPEREAEPEPEREAEPEPEAPIPPEVRCARDDECTTGRDACNGLIGVRRDHAAEHEARMAELRPVVDCMGIGETAPRGELRGYCHDSRCIGGDSAKRCSSSDECIEVEGACGMFDVVHRDFEAQVREGFNRRAAVMSCMAGTRPPELRVECRAGLCVGNPLN